LKIFIFVTLYINIYLHALLLIIYCYYLTSTNIHNIRFMKIERPLYDG